MGSMDSSKPKVLLLFLQSFTAPKTPLAAANLAVLGRKQPLTAQVSPCCCSLRFAGSWGSTKKHSLSSEDTKEKGHPSNCALPCGCSRLSQGQVLLLGQENCPKR